VTWFHDFHPDLGSVPDWLEAICTAGAFIGVAITLRMQLNDRRAQEASNVDYYVRRENPSAGIAGPPRVVLTIVNHNRTAINDLVVALPLATDNEQQRKWVSLGKIPHGTYKVPYHVLDPASLKRPRPPNYALWVPFVRFRDANNRLWQRSARGALKRLHNDLDRRGGEVSCDVERVPYDHND
jgi:hypothetical protein